MSYWRIPFCGRAHKLLPRAVYEVVLFVPEKQLAAFIATRTSEPVAMRTTLLLEQTRIRFPRLDIGQIKIRPIEKGGSDRKFYRILCPQHQALILVKYNLQREENRHYVEIAQFLAARGIRVPKIYFHDPAEGLIWIEDLGQRDLYSYRRESWLARRALYESALEEIAKLHRLSLSEAESIRPSLAVEFNAALYRWEQNYFFENCLGRLFKIDKRTLRCLPPRQGSLQSRNGSALWSEILCTAIFNRKTSLCATGRLT